MKPDRTRRSAWLGVAALCLSGGLAAGQGSMKLMIPQGSLLPMKFGGWVAAGVETAKIQAVPAIEGKAAEVLKEDGLTRSAQESYTTAGGSGIMTVKAYQFDDATGAVSAFTYLRLPEMKMVAQSAMVGHDEAAAGGHFLIREGVSVLDVAVSAPGPSLVADLRALAVTMPKVGGPKGASPLLPTYLPAKGLIPESIHYAVGAVGYAAMGGTLPAEVLGFNKSTETATAEYAVHRGRGVLTLLLFPTPQIAGDRGRAIERALNAAGERAGTAKLRREGPMVMLAAGGFTPVEAKEVIDGIHLRTEVTWNKAVPPEFHTEVRKTASLLVSIAVLCGVLGLAAVLLGLFLGFGRAWVRVLMGKPAATEPEFLRLNISGQPRE